MRHVLCKIALIVVFSYPGFAEQWEIGALGGFGWYRNSRISNVVIASPPPTSGRVGFPSRATIGMVVGEDRYDHWGGEFRWLFQWGGPHIRVNDIRTSMSGYSNLITYDLLLYPAGTDSEPRFRPYIAGGGGVKIFTATGFRFLGQGPTEHLALLRPVTEAEPAISIGGGLKWLVAKHTQLRFDFRTYFSPTPDDVIRPTRFTDIRGWLVEFVPTVGISYVFEDR